VNRPAGATRGDGTSWRLHAACADEDIELFFPVGTGGPALAQIAAAKDTCARCPVREACLRYALTTGQGRGIWGGLTEGERCGMRYQEQRSEPPAEPGRRSQAPPPAPRARPSSPAAGASTARHGRMSASHTGRREPPCLRRTAVWVEADD
jgi:WhiB family redox-sensing transcriptional regulator